MRREVVRSSGVQSAQRHDLRVAGTVVNGTSRTAADSEARVRTGTQFAQQLRVADQRQQRTHLRERHQGHAWLRLRAALNARRGGRRAATARRARAARRRLFGSERWRVAARKGGCSLRFVAPCVGYAVTVSCCG